MFIRKVLSLTKKQAIAEQFFCGNTLSLLIRLEKLIPIFLVSKSPKFHPEKRVIAEQFCCGNKLPLLIKLEKLVLSSLVFKKW